ncbi:MAG: RNA polymerase sigma factor [Eubacteriaceae bacterium]|jgi:RNA polymerase sigma-70 factor (ECF subfamily)|nr:RNA polymerase sigma factor [Eubacteriaceae bacterium]
MLLLNSVLEPSESSLREKHLIDVDEQLMVRIAGNDTAAFGELYEASHKAMFAYALSIIKNPEDAKDAVHEAYLKIKHNAHLYKSAGKPMAWIITILKNECLMMLRKKKRETALDPEEAMSDYSGIKRAEDKMVLETAMRVLDEQEAAIVMLHAVEGMKHSQIAAITGLKLSTVLSKYSRAIHKLKKEMRKGGIS